MKRILMVMAVLLSASSCSTLQGYEKAYGNQTADKRIEDGKYKSYKGSAHKQVVANWEHTATPVLPFYIIDFLLSYVGDFVMLPFNNGKEKENPLHRAAVESNIEEIKKLVAVDSVDVNTVGETCHTPLMAAVAANKLESVKLLIELGADPYKKITCLKDDEEVIVTAYDYVSEDQNNQIRILLNDIALRDNRLEDGEFKK